MYIYVIVVSCLCRDQSTTFQKLIYLNLFYLYSKLLGISFLRVFSHHYSAKDHFCFIRVKTLCNLLYWRRLTFLKSEEATSCLGYYFLFWGCLLNSDQRSDHITAWSHVVLLKQCSAFNAVIHGWCCGNRLFLGSFARPGCVTWWGL